MYVVFPGDGSGKVQESISDEDWIILAVICPGCIGTKQKWNLKYLLFTVTLELDGKTGH